MPKARQLGVTWVTSGYALWKALFFEGANVIIVSKSEEAAKENLDYCKYMYENLPWFLKIERGGWQRALISFPPMASKIRALSATESAGIGFGGASLILMDEFDFHPYDKENYAEIKPMIDAGGNRQLVILSARNVRRDDTKFMELINAAIVGDTNFFIRFLGYDLPPYRDQAWYDERAKEYEDWEMLSRYPRNMEDILATPTVLCRFDEKAVRAMATECPSPMEERESGAIKIFRPSVAGRKYVFTIDPSEGSYDPACGIIIDWQTNEEVASFNARMSVDKQARIIGDLYEEYNKPYYAVERNAAGILLIEKLMAMGLKNSYYHKPDKPGWWTNSTNRPVMITELAVAVKQRIIRPSSRHLTSQFLNFIVTPKHPDGKALRSSHDDYVMCWAMNLQIRKSMPMGNMKISSFHYRD